MNDKSGSTLGAESGSTLGSEKNYVIYDMEVAPNLIMLGVKVAGQDRRKIYEFTGGPEDNGQWEEVAKYFIRNKNVVLVGFNNSGYDQYILQAGLCGFSPEKIYHISRELIESDESAWSIMERANLPQSLPKQLDLMHYHLKGSLKKYEARMGMMVKNLPFDPHQPIESERLPVVREYLAHDLDATDALFQKAQGDIAVRRRLGDLSGIEDLEYRTPASAASAAIYAFYEQHLARLGIDAPPPVSLVTRQNQTFDFELQDWVWDAIRGCPAAESFADSVTGAQFEIVAGRRIGPINFQPLPDTVTVDHLDISVGLGGVHSIDGAFSFQGYGADVASYYPHLALQTGGCPNHLDQTAWSAALQGVIDRRMAAKHGGDKGTSDALKLALNSGAFGVQNEMFNKNLYSPKSFLHITLSGQVLLIALAETIQRDAPDSANVVSVNTDGVFFQCEDADYLSTRGIIEAWAERSRMRMEHFRIDCHRQLHINAYQQIVREETDVPGQWGTPRLKAKGSLDPTPGLLRDHNNVVINKRLANSQFGADLPIEPRDYYSILTTRAGSLWWGDEDIGKVAQVVRAQTPEYPYFRLPAAGKALDKSIGRGFAPAWTVGEDAVDTDWYDGELLTLIAETDAPFCPEIHNAARELQSFGYRVYGTFEGATRATTKPKTSDPYHGCDELWIQLGGKGGLMCYPGLVAGTLIAVRAREGDEFYDFSIVHKGRLSREERKQSQQNKRALVYRQDGTAMFTICGKMPEGTPDEKKPRQNEEESPAEATLRESKCETIPPSMARQGGDVPMIVNNCTGVADFFQVLYDAVPPWTASISQSGGAMAYGPLDERLNCYTSISTFSGDGRERQKRQFERLHVILLDDCQGIPPGWSEPTAIIETTPIGYDAIKPGSRQYIWNIEAVDASEGNIARVVDSIVLNAEGNDKAALGINRVYRPGIGRNSKPENQAIAKAMGLADWELGTPVRLVAWNPERKYRLDEIMAWAGVSLDVLTQSEPEYDQDAASDEQVEAHPVIEALDGVEVSGHPILINGTSRNPRGWVEIHCPWEAEHSGDQFAKDDDTGLKFDNSGTWSFHCMHSCAEQHNSESFRQFLVDEWERDIPPSFQEHTRLLDSFEFSECSKSPEAAESVTRPVTEIYTLRQMEDRLVLVGGDRVADLSRNPKRALKIDAAKTYYLPSKQNVEDDKGKVKSVPVLNLWVNGANRMSVDMLGWYPGQKRVFTNPEGDRILNYYKPLVFPATTGEIADWCVWTFKNHVRYLFADDSEKFLDWLAHIIQHPAVLPHSGWLHISPKTGTGRGSLGAMLAKVLNGYANTGLDFDSIVQWGDGLSEKLLLVVEEIRSGNRRETYKHVELVKRMMTEANRDLNIKYGPNLREQNCARWLVCSNHEDALAVDHTDRRWWVVRCTEEPKPAEYYTKLHTAINHAAFGAAVGGFLANRDISRFNPGERPTMSAAKTRVIEAMRSPQSEVLEELKVIFDALGWVPSIIVSSCLSGFMRGAQSRDTMPPPGPVMSHYRPALRDAGFERLARLRVLPGGKADNIWGFKPAREQAAVSRDAFESIIEPAQFYKVTQSISRAAEWLMDPGEFKVEPSNNNILDFPLPPEEDPE